MGTKILQALAIVLFTSVDLKSIKYSNHSHTCVKNGFYQLKGLIVVFCVVFLLLNESGVW